MRDWCSSHCTLLLPNTSCGKPPAGPSTENPRNTQETSVCRSNKGGDLFAKHRGRRRGGRGRGNAQRKLGWVSGRSYLIWKLLGVLCSGGGHSWPHTVATHVSSSVHSSLLFLSLSWPPPTPSSLSFLSSTQTLRGTIDPRLWSQKRRGNSSLSRLLLLRWWGGGVHGRFFTVSEMIRWKPVSLSARQTQAHHCFNSCPDCTWLTVSHSLAQQPVQLSVCLSLGLSLGRSLSASPCVSEFPSDLSGHISAASYLWQPPALTAGRSQGGWDRWSMSHWQEWLKAALPLLWQLLSHSVLIWLILSFRLNLSQTFQFCKNKFEKFCLYLSELFKCISEQIFPHKSSS